jgi:peptidoglycan LD-endopeptidase CwlK
MSEHLFAEDVLFLQRFLQSGNLYRGRLDGIWGPVTDAVHGSFLARTEALAAELGRFDGRSERLIASLHLPAQRAARRFLARLHAADLDACLVSGTRSYGEQNLLYRRGRFGNPAPRVTNARGGQSNHNFAIAWDIGIFVGGAYVPNDPAPYRQAAELGLESGLEWGGDWKSFQDLPHYQLAVGRPTAAIRASFEAGQAYC